MSYKAPRGTHDLWGEDADKLRKLEDISREVFKKFNYSKLKTPIFEDAGLFTRSIGETTDIIEKEMYIFEDRKGRKLALRPEGTASIVRALVEHNLLQQNIMPKFFYSGSMYRYERPQAGRYREFYQIGAEYFGDNSPLADAEIILLAAQIFEKAGLDKIDVRLNSLGCAKCRPDFKKALLEYLNPNESKSKDLCGDCARRINKNPLRVLDCKVDGHKFNDIPKMENYLCSECKVHFEEVQNLLNIVECKFTVDHKMVRGLDYYTKTIFEIRSDLVGSQDALAAGGRYDNLVKELGGSPTPAVGFALGSERAVMALTNLKKGFGTEENKIVFIAITTDELEKEAFKFASKYRKSAIDDLKIEGPLANKSLKSQLRFADKIGAKEVIIFGEEEFKRGCVTVRNMKTQEQSERKISELVD